MHATHLSYICNVMHLFIDRTREKQLSHAQSNQGFLLFVHKNFFKAIYKVPKFWSEKLKSKQKFICDNFILNQKFRKNSDKHFLKLCKKPWISCWRCDRFGARIGDDSSCWVQPVRQGGIVLAPLISLVHILLIIYVASLCRSAL